MTTGIMAIVYCAPLSAILMNSLGTVLVDKDEAEVTPTEEESLLGI